MFYFLLDTNILRTYLHREFHPTGTQITEYVKNSSEYLSQLQNMWLVQQALFFIPNVIVIEFKKHCAEQLIKKKTDKAKYREFIRNLIDLVEYSPSADKDSDYNIFFNVELNRHHVIDFCKVSEIVALDSISRKEKDKNAKTLSYADMMLLSMSIELKHIHRDNVFILSNDKVLVDTANNNPHIFPHAIYPASDTLLPKFKRILKKYS